MEYPDSALLLEAAAIYMVIHKHYYDNRDWYIEKGWKLPSLRYAWDVAGDYFFVIKTRREKQSRPGARRGPAPICNPHETARLWSGRAHQRGAPMTDSQEM